MCVVHQAHAIVVIIVSGCYGLVNDESSLEPRIAGAMPSRGGLAVLLEFNILQNNSQVNNQMKQQCSYSWIVRLHVTMRMVFYCSFAEISCYRMRSVLKIIRWESHTKLYACISTLCSNAAFKDDVLQFSFL